MRIFLSYWKIITKNKSKKLYPIKSIIYKSITCSFCHIFVSSQCSSASHFIERLPLESTHSFAGSLWLDCSSAGQNRTEPRSVWFFGVRPSDRRRQHPHPHHWPGPFCSFSAFIYFKFISFGGSPTHKHAGLSGWFFQLVKTRLAQRIALGVLRRMKLELGLRLRPRPRQGGILL